MSVLQSVRLTACPSYRGFFCFKGIGLLPGNCQVSVLERCPSYGMSVLMRFHSYIYFSVNKGYMEIKTKNKEKSLKKRNTSAMKQKQCYTKRRKKPYEAKR